MSQTADIASSIARTLSELIEAAPEGNDTEEQPKATTGAILAKNGWGAKYIQPIDLHGERWMAELQRAKATVAAGGIVAMVGGRGPGKTQMAAEIARAGDWPEDKPSYTRGENVLAVHRGKTALYVRAMDLFLDFRHAQKNHVQSSEKEVLEKHARVGLLVIDEFQERGESPWENRIMKNLIDKRYSDGRPTIIIANMNRGDMGAALGDSVKDRVRECGCVIEFNWPSYRAAKPPQPPQP
jgi:DNA replication protein DnaC